MVNEGEIRSLFYSGLKLDDIRRELFPDLYLLEGEEFKNKRDTINNKILEALGFADWDEYREKRSKITAQSRKGSWKKKKKEIEQSIEKRSRIGDSSIVTESKSVEFTISRVLEMNPPPDRHNSFQFQFASEIKSRVFEGEVRINHLPPNGMMRYHIWYSNMASEVGLMFRMVRSKSEESTKTRAWSNYLKDLKNLYLSVERSDIQLGFCLFITNDIQYRAILNDAEMKGHWIDNESIYSCFIHMVDISTVDFQVLSSNVKKQSNGINSPEDSQMAEVDNKPGQEKKYPWKWFKDDEIIGENTWDVLQVVSEMIEDQRVSIELDDSEIQPALSKSFIEKHAMDIWTWPTPPEISKIYIAKVVDTSALRFKRKFFPISNNDELLASNFYVGDVVEVGWTYEHSETLRAHACRRYYVVTRTSTREKAFYLFAERNVREFRGFKKQTARDVSK